MSPSYQILSHFRHCWPNTKPCSQGATTTYLRRSGPSFDCLQLRTRKRLLHLTPNPAHSHVEGPGTDRCVIHAWPSSTSTAGALSSNACDLPNVSQGRLMNRLAAPGSLECADERSSAHSRLPGAASRFMSLP